MIDTVLNDRYKLERRIGRGGFAEVFKARDLKLEIDVAVKVLSDSGHDDQYRKRFLRETASTAKLIASPHVVTVLDCGEVNTRPYLVMELVEGITLQELAEKSRPDLAEVLRLGQQVCRGMDHAHQHGIIHRDLSLNNIMVTVKGDAKVLDFGLARLEDSKIKTDAHVIMGTRQHLAPEHLAGDEVDGRADVFAFGVCLYYLVNGRFPFDAEHPASINFLIQHDDPAPFESEVPFDVRDVVLRCLEKDPRHRFQTFKELEEQLELLRKQYQSSGAVTTTFPSIKNSVRNRSSKRNPYLNRVMIKNPDDFFGRGREVNRIFSRLDAQFPQSIAVVGERRVGKSSLLNYVYQRRNRRHNMQNYHNAIFVFMDFQRGPDIDIKRFIDVLFGMFRYERHEAKALASKEKTLDTLRDVIEELGAQGKRIIILMDEFDAITTNPNFDMQFFSFLRFLANNYKVAFVTSSLNDLQQMCHDKEIADSPFFNIFSNLPLRPFNRDEALELISVPSSREGVPLDDYSEQVLELSGLFPFFIQMACSNTFENLVERDGSPDWEQIRKSFTDEAEPHYKSIWDRMDDNHRINMHRVASGREIDKKFRHINEEMNRLGYLHEVDGHTEIFSEPFRQFVLNQQGAQRTKKRFWSGWLPSRGE